MSLKIINMGDPSTEKLFYHRLNKFIYHMLIIKTEFLVFHEVTEGPFVRLDTVFPDWAPEEFDSAFMKIIMELT